VFASDAIIDASSFGEGVVGGMQALRGSFLRPNLVFLTLTRDPGRQAELQHIISKARENRLGVLLFAKHPAAGLGLEKSINIWIHDRSPDWSIHMDMGNLDLCLLFTYIVQRNWKSKNNLITVVQSQDDVPKAEEYLRSLVELTRLPGPNEFHVRVGDYRSHLSDAPEGDLHIFGLPKEFTFEQINAIMEETRASCAFLLESGEESSLA